MCGIAGILTTNTHIHHQDISHRLIQQLQHRGPDHIDTQQIDQYCTLSHARLKIIDLSNAANQPMYCYQKRFVIVFNGEIYNYPALKLELQRVAYQSSDKPYPFSTQSDTEVILAAYHRWGKNCVQYLDGMFAFVIYDTLTHTLFAARDRQGKKPLYYILHPHTFIFSSEISPLIHSSFSSKQLNKEQLYDYYQYQSTFSTHTLIEDIHSLAPAHTLTISLNNTQHLHIEKQNYWKPITYTLNTKDISYEESVKQVRTLLFSAIEKRLISDVPIGAFLSGGIDSSAIVSIMKQFFSSKVNTFHVHSNFSKYNEKNYAEHLSTIYQTAHHNITLSESDVLNMVIESLDKMDYPSGDGINTYIVSNATKKAGITVALSGLGGDELFAGYPQFKILYKLHISEIFDFSWIRKNLAKLIPHNQLHTAYRLKILMQSSSLHITRIFPYYRQIFLQNNIPLALPHYTSHFNTFSSEKKLFPHHILSYISLVEMTNYMQPVLLRDADQMSMANALEIRCPFLDSNLVTFVLSLPDEYKYPTSPKKILTDALKDLLPHNIVQRKKMGFVLPFEWWMRKELKSFCESKIQHITTYPFIKKEVLLKEWHDFQTAKHNRWWMFWHLIVWQHWIEKNKIHIQ